MLPLESNNWFDTGLLGIKKVNIIVKGYNLLYDGEMLGVTLKDRKRSEVMYSLLGVQRHGRLRWFGHVERKSGDNWVSACRNVVVTGVRCAGRGRKTWRECVKDDTDELGLQPEEAVFRDMWRGLVSLKTFNPS